MTIKEVAFEKVSQLVERFSEQYESYIKSEYNETLTRRDFIDSFFKALGWDIDNENGYTESYREVIHEDRVKIGKADNFRVTVVWKNGEVLEFTFKIIVYGKLILIKKCQINNNLSFAYSRCNTHLFFHNFISLNKFSFTVGERKIIHACWLN